LTPTTSLLPLHDALPIYGRLKRSQRRRPNHDSQGHHPSRRQRHAALPLTRVVSKAAAAGLRQPDDLLPAVGADAGRRPRRAGHYHAGGPGRLCAAARRRQRLGYFARAELDVHVRAAFSASTTASRARSYRLGSAAGISREVAEFPKIPAGFSDFRKITRADFLIGVADAEIRSQDRPRRARP